MASSSQFIELAYELGYFSVRWTAGPGGKIILVVNALHRQAAGRVGRGSHRTTASCRRGRTKFAGGQYNEPHDQSRSRRSGETEFPPLLPLRTTPFGVYRPNERQHAAVHSKRNGVACRASWTACPRRDK